MEQLKHYLAFLGRHHFWFLSGLLAVVALISWWLASADLQKDFRTQKAQVDAAAKKSMQIVKTDPHPNGGWVNFLSAETTALQANVRDAWNRLYNDQKKNVFIWPKRLGKDFLDIVNDPAEPPSEIPVNLRERYQNSVEKELKRLAEIVDARYVDDPAEGAGGRGQEGPRRPQFGRGGIPKGLAKAAAPKGEEAEEEGPIHKVIWNGQDVIQKNFNWDEWPNAHPTTLAVRAAQEDLWVYEALCRVVAHTNEGATGPHDAVVKVIDEMAIGFDAAEEYVGGAGQKRVIRVKPPVRIDDSQVSGSGQGGQTVAAAIGERLTRPSRGPGGSTSGNSFRGPDAAAPNVYGPSGEAAGAASGPNEWVREWRYVDRQGKPLTAAEFQAPPFVEFNLMPFTLRVLMDQRQVDRMLVEFRNLALPLAVRQFRIGSQNRARGVADEAGVQIAARQQDEGLDTSFDIPVEFRGVAYIINPPNNKELGITAEATDVAAADPADKAGKKDDDAKEIAKAPADAEESTDEAKKNDEAAVEPADEDKKGDEAAKEAATESSDEPAADEPKDDAKAEEKAAEKTE